MAQRQYSFDFILNAVLNGGFSATFTKAQQEFIRLGNEIKNLQAIQRDVNAYEKQAAAVQNTSTKLDNLRRQYELIKKQISETTGSTTALEREKLKLEQRIANTSNALENQKEKLEGTKERLDAAGVSTDDLSAKDAELTKKIQELTEEQKRAAEGAGEFKDKAVEAVEAVGSAITAAGIATAVKEIAEAYGECVGVSADFGKAMSAVEAISEANRSEMAALKAEAKELGATTIHTAQQSAKGMEYMAMAGWDAQETLSGIKGTTTLAAAAGEDLAQVSDIVTDSLSGFNLRASDTAHFVDVLAATAANSNTKIAIMGDTFKRSSSVAGALGYSIEDVSVLVGLMADRAVKGSRAGTALLNIFNGLLGGVTLTAAAFGEAEYSAVNYDGSMKGLMETVEDLRGYFSQMTEAERVNNAMAIAGMRGYNGLLAILNASDEQFQSLYESIYNCSGAAERMASVKLDNLAGDITLMNSATEALQTTIGEQFNPELRKLTQLETELINGVNSFIKENPSLVKGVMAGAGAFGALSAGIVGVNAAIKVYQTLKAAALFAEWTGPLLGAAGALAVLTGGVYAAIDAQNEMVSEYDDVLDAHRKAEDAYRDSIAAIDEEAGETYALIEQLRELSGQSEKTAAEQEKIANIVDQLNASIPELNLSYDKETDTLIGLSGSVDDYVKSLYEAKKAERDIAGAVELYDSIKETENALEEARAELERYKKEYDGIASSGGELGGISSTIDTYRAKVAQLEAQLAQERGEYEALNAAIEAHKDIQENVKEAQEALTAEEAEIQEALGETMDSLLALGEAYEEVYNKALESFQGQFGLFDEAKADTDATVANAQAALNSQLSYWQDYAANIEVLRQYSADDLHLTQENYDALMAYVRSGTPEAAGLAADMTNAINEGNTEALTNLGETIGQLAEMREQAAQDVAEWTTGIMEEAQQLVSDMETAVEDLDMSSDAGTYARRTMQSYVNGINAMIPQVQAAYARAAAAASSLGGVSIGGGASSGIVNGVKFFASGTDSAPPGWAWVGEEGPELMRLRGGEQILPTEASRQVAEDYAAYSRYTTDVQGVQPARALEIVETGTTGTTVGKIEMHFHIEAGASPETVDAWQEYARRGELKATIREVLEDVDADMRRRVLR